MAERSEINKIKYNILKYSSPIQMCTDINKRDEFSSCKIDTDNNDEKFVIIDFAMRGRLGNQLFAIARALKIAHITGRKLLLPDIKVIDEERGTTEDRFNACSNNPNWNEIFRYIDTNPERCVMSMLREKDYVDLPIIEKFTRLDYIKQKKNPKDISTKYLMLINSPGAQMLNIDWGNPGWNVDDFDDIRNTLVSVFTKFMSDLPFAETLNKLKKQLAHFNKTIALHVRGGDFGYDEASKGIYFGVLGFEYYKTALEKMNAHTLDNTIVVIFSSKSDLPLTSLLAIYLQNLFQNLQFKTQHDVDGGTFSTSYDLVLMSYFDYIVTSNSTFGFWGAYLAQSPSKVIFPMAYGGNLKNWLPHCSTTFTDELLPFLPELKRPSYDDNYWNIDKIIYLRCESFLLPQDFPYIKELLWYNQLRLLLTLITRDGINGNINEIYDFGYKSICNSKLDPREKIELLLEFSTGNSKMGTKNEIGELVKYFESSQNPFVCVKLGELKTFYANYDLLIGRLQPIDYYHVRI